MFKYTMHVKNSLTEYGFISKSLHWLSAILLLIQIPLGFYLVDLDFGEERITIENIIIYSIKHMQWYVYLVSLSITIAGEYREALEL